MDEIKILGELLDPTNDIQFASSLNETVSLNDAGKVKIWTERFGSVSPRQVSDFLSRGFAHISISLSIEKSQINIIFTYQNGSKADVKLCPNGPLSECLNFYLHELNVSRDGRGKNIAKKVLSNLVEFTQLHSVDFGKITLSAFKIGCYAWARFGFVPDSQSWQVAKGPIFCIAATESVKSQLTIEEAAMLEKASLSSDPKSIWKIADMKRVVLDPWDDYKEIALGKLLLKDNPYNAVLDLKDPETLERFQTYVGISALDPMKPHMPRYTQPNSAQTII